ncbi:MAG: PP2C family protein-serine/threonine phosphatase [Thermomicrobiales bacterium]
MTDTERLPTSAIAEDQLRIAVGFATDRGGRAENEDAVYVGEFPISGVGAGDQPGLLLAVADGMGGHEGGEVASRIAVETLKEVMAAGSSSDAETAQLLKQAFRRANERIYAQGEGQNTDMGMGTTLVAAATRGKYATIANVGDSRAYLIRANRLTQITKDHSLVAQQIADGSLSATRARTSPQRNILTHALGQQERLDSKLPGIFEIALLPDDRLLLCSDGFYDVASNDDLIASLLSTEADVAATSLVALANDRGASDNVTAIVASVRAAKVREPVLVGAETGRPSALTSVLILVAALVIIAIIAAVYLLL